MIYYFYYFVSVKDNLELLYIHIEKTLFELILSRREYDRLNQSTNPQPRNQV